MLDLEKIDLHEELMKGEKGIKSEFPDPPKKEEEEPIDEKKEKEVKKEEPLKVVAKEEEEEEEEEEDEDEGLIDGLLKRFQYEVPEGVEITEDETGLDRAVDLISDYKAVEKMEAFFDAYPDVRDFINYIRLGGHPSNYLETKYPNVDYSEIDIKDELTMKSVIFTYFRADGMDNEKIQKKIDKWDAAGILEDEAEEILEKLQKKQKAEQEVLMAKQEEEAQERIEQNQKYWGGINKTLETTEKIAGLSIPIKDRKGIWEYMAVAKKDGKSQEMVHDEEIYNNPQLRIALAIYKKILVEKGDLSQYITTEAKTIVAKEKLKFKTGQLKISGKSAKLAPTIDIEDLHSELIKQEKTGQ